MAPEKNLGAAVGTSGAERLFETIERKIMDAIVDGTLQPGDPLPSENELMEHYGVGRRAVREALSSLRIKGFLDVRRGGRPVVNPPNIRPLADYMSDLGRLMARSESGIYQLTEMRRLIESALAWEAAKEASDSDISDLQCINEENATHFDNPSEFLNGDLRFHKKIFEISANPFFDAFYDSFVTWDVPLRIESNPRALVYTHHQHLEATHLQHVAIADEIAKRSPEGAYSMMNTHLHRSQSQRVERVRRGN